MPWTIRWTELRARLQKMTYGPCSALDKATPHVLAPGELIMNRVRRSLCNWKKRRARWSQRKDYEEFCFGSSAPSKDTYL